MASRVSLAFVLLGTPAWWAVGVVLRKVQNSTEPVPSRLDMSLKNIGDTDFIFSVDVGDRQVEAILDTASFDIVVFSTSCSQCLGDALYSSNGSKTYRHGEVTKDTFYGSGSIHSREGFEQFTLCQRTRPTDVCSSGISVPDQFFWEVLESNLQFDVGKEWQMILGLGPPGGSVQIASDNYDFVEKQLLSLGDEVTDEQRLVVDQVKEIAEEAKTSTAFLDHFEVQNFSICFGTSGRSGRVVWNDDPPVASSFQYVPVIGDMYWSSQLQNVQLAGDSEALGCVGSPCSGLVDSGTTLLAAPPSFVTHLTERLMRWRSDGGDCQDLSALPDLQFVLGGKAFRLPPASYMGKVDGTLNLDNKELMLSLPHLQHIRDLPQRATNFGPSGAQALSVSAHANRLDHALQAALWTNFSRNCVPLLMTVDEVTKDGDMWILGAPFFKEYYATFALEQVPGDRPKPEGMYFALADTECRPQHGSSVVRRHTVGGLSLDVSKIRIPSVSFSAHY